MASLPLPRAVLRWLADEGHQIRLDQIGAVDAVEPLDLVDLLSHPSADVRKSAVMRLSNENDIMVQKLVSQGYDDEKDPAIRALYEAHVPVVQNRNRPPS